MASVSTFLLPSPTPKSKPPILKPFTFNPLKPQMITLTPKTKQTKNLSVIRSLPNDLDVIPTTDQQDGVTIGLERETEMVRLSFEGAGFSSGSGGGEREVEEEGVSMVNRGINAAIVLAAGAFALSKLLTIDQEYWHGWTVYEIVRYAPQHNWSAYEAALKTNPVLAKMVISGVVYSVGDWIAQCVEGKPLFDFDRTRMFRSGLVGFTLHGSLSHYYYQFCEVLFPFHGWWVVPVKVVFDQTVWSGIWNSIYFTVLGFLRWESPVSIASELKATFVPMLTAGWKLWPFAHLITYGVVPVEQRLLWVDCVELIWVTILSTYSNEKSEARILESQEADSSSPSTAPSEE